jgi:hypothetical protein
MAPEAWDWREEPPEDDHAWGLVDWDEPYPPNDVFDRRELGTPVEHGSRPAKPNIHVESDGSESTSRFGYYLAWGTAALGMLAHLCILAAFRSINIASLQPFSGSIAWAWMTLGALVLMAATATAALVVAAVRKQVRLALSTVASVAVVLFVAGLVVQSEVMRLQRNVELYYLQDPAALIERARVWMEELGVTRAAIERLIRELPIP